MSIKIKLSLAYDRQDEIRELFQEYTDMLVGLNSEFGMYLTLQNYDSEREHPEHKYGLPDGRLYLAEVDGQSAGWYSKAFVRFHR